MSALSVNVTTTRRQRVRLNGVLTSASAERLLDSLRAAPGPARVEVDLSDVSRVDRSGACLLLDAYVATVLRRGVFALSGPSPGCRASLERFGVLDVVDLIETQPLGPASLETM